MVEIMFEKFGAPATYISIQAVLALYATGETTGLVLDSGDGVTHTVPIFEGYTFNHAITRLDLAGRDVTEYLSTLLTGRGIRFQTAPEKEIAREIKEKLAFVADDFDAEMKKPPNTFEVEYSMPDGKKITVGNERFRCTEVLFQPDLLGKDTGGVQHMCFKSVNFTDIDIRPHLFEHVVLSGGSTLYKGYDQRLKKELAKLSKMKVTVNNTLDRKFAVFLGGSILADLNTFREKWILRSEYDEIGSGIVHRKCF